MKRIAVHLASGHPETNHPGETEPPYVFVDSNVFDDEQAEVRLQNVRAANPHIHPGEFTLLDEA